MQGIQEITTREAAQPTVISSEDLKALLYLTIRGQNGLAPQEKSAAHAPTESGPAIDSEHGVDVKA